MSNFLVLTADDEGIIYAVNASGDLEWYRDKARDGVSSYNSWVNGQGQKIKAGWGEFTHIVSGGNGVIYAVDPGGDLLYFRDRARDGTEDWAYGGVSQQIGTGWGGFQHIVGGGCGILYAVNADGNLLYYRDRARDGTEDWAYGGAGQQIGTGWDGFQHIVGGGCGILYAVNADGNLLYYRDRARDGTEDWAYGGAGQQIGTGWGRFASILGGGCGTIYATTPDQLSEDPFGSTDYMYYYRDKAQDGTQNWANSGQGQQIGSGW